jgi:hypothetical protein
MEKQLGKLLPHWAVTNLLTPHEVLCTGSSATVGS